MPDTPLVFNHTLQGLFSRTFPQGVPPELKTQLRAAGVDLDKPLLPAYSLEVWSRCIELSAPLLFPHERRELAWRHLGERLIEGYQETMIGRALFATLKLLGPRRMLQRSRKNFRSGNNYTEVELSDVSPTQMDVWFNERNDTLRHFTAGLVLAGLRVGGAREPEVNILRADERGVTLRASWKDKS